MTARRYYKRDARGRFTFGRGAYATMRTFLRLRTFGRLRRRTFAARRKTILDEQVRQGRITPAAARRIAARYRR